MLQPAFHALIAKIQAPYQAGSALGHKPAALGRTVEGENQPGQRSGVRMHKAGCERPEMVTDSRQPASMKFSIAAEEKQPFDIADGFSGAGMGLSLIHI